MFEQQVAYWLKVYLGKYVQGLDAESLRISVWKGDVVLSNLALKPEALQDLDLPITVKAGVLGRLTLKVPWARLGWEPVLIEFDRLYILAGPRADPDQENCKNLQEFISASNAAEQADKSARVAAAEQAWLQSLANRIAAATAAAAQKAASSQGGSGQPGGDGKQPASAVRSVGVGRFPSIQSVIGPILGNLQLVVTNIHIRYEDDVAWPGHTLSVGVLLSRLAAQTVDEAGNPAWVAASLQQLLRKAITLADLAVYLDVDRPMCALPKGVTSWQALTGDQWDALFLPASHVPKQTPGVLTKNPAVGAKGAGGLAGLLPVLSQASHEHDFLIRPVSGSLRYTRRGKSAAVTDPSMPYQDWRLSLQSVTVCLSSDQYAGAQSLAEYMDSMARAAPHRHLRPRCRPASGLAARMWWVYAITATRKQVRFTHLNWSSLRRVAQLRKKYVPMYSAWLTEGNTPGAALPAALKEMETELAEATILQFRRMAHTKAGTTKGGSPGSPGSKQQKTSGGGDAATAGNKAAGRTWAQWMGLSRPATQTSAGGSQTGAAASTEAVPELSTAEWSRLQELLTQQEEVEQPETDTSAHPPDQLKTRFGMECKSLQLQLTARNEQLPTGRTPKSSPAPGHRRRLSGLETATAAVPPNVVPTPSQTSTTVVIASASAYRLQLAVQVYPQTRAYQLRVGSARITAPQGDIFYVGAAMPLASTPAHAMFSGYGQKPSSKPANMALQVAVVQAPQSGHADLVVDAHIAPSFVTYIPEAVNVIRSFFTPKRELELEALQAQAAVQGEELWQLASMRLQALSEAAARPKLDLTLCAHAPKLALPHPDGGTVLLVDLGKLQLQANKELEASLQGEEATLYDCISASLDSLATYLLNCPPGTIFAWPHQHEQQHTLMDSEPSTAANSPVAPRSPATTNREQGLALMNALDTWGVGGGGTGSPVKDSPAKQNIKSEATSRFGKSFEELHAIAPSKQPDTPPQNSPAAGSAKMASAFQSYFTSGPEAKAEAASIAAAVPAVVDDNAWDLSAWVASLDQQGMQLIPLLDRFSMEASIQAARAVHPRYPKFRVSLSCSRLHLHVSPARYHRLMACVAAFSHQPPTTLSKGNVPVSQRGGSVMSVGFAAGETPLPAWLTDAEYQAEVSVKDMVQSSGKKVHWQGPRVVRVWRGRVYVTHDSLTTEPLTQMPYWHGGWSLLRVPDNTPGIGNDYVLLLAPKAAVEAVAASTAAKAGSAGGSPDATLERAETVEPNTVPTARDASGHSGLAQQAARAKALLRHPATIAFACGSADALARLHASLARSRSTMQAVAGLLHGSTASNGSSAGDDAGLEEGAGAEQGDVLSRLVSHSELVEVKATVPEVLLHLQGRKPPTIVPDQSGGTAAETEQTDDDESDRVGMPPSFEEEVPLITAKLQAALVDFANNGSRSHFGAAMRALVIQDMLMGAHDPALGILAHSGDIVQSTQLAKQPTVGPLGHPATSVKQGSQKASASTAAASGEQPAGLAATASGDSSEDEFFDAAASWVTPSSSPDVSSQLFAPGMPSGGSFSGPSQPTSANYITAGDKDAQAGSAAASDVPKAPPLPSSALGGGAPAEPLVWLAYTAWTPGADQHPGVAAQLALKLSSVTIRTHRPTISALITLGWDIMAVNYLLAPSPAAAGQTAAQVAAGMGVARDTDSDADDVSSSFMLETPSTSVMDAPTTTVTTSQATGGQPTAKPLIIWRLLLEMKKLEVLLPYESPSHPAFARAAMESSSFRLDMTADSMDITTQLGNLVAVCEVLPETSPYRTVCQLRPEDATTGSSEEDKKKGSLITIHLTSRQAAKAPVGDRAPADGITTVYHVTAELQAVQIVYLQCLLSQFMQYLYVMLSMGPRSRLPTPATTTDDTQDTTNTSSQQAAQPGSVVPYVLILDVQAGAPLIIYPRSKTSIDGLEADLGRLELHNSMSWQPAANAPGWQHLMDNMKVRLWGVGLVVVQPDGTRSANCVHDLGGQGILLTVSRAVTAAPKKQLAGEARVRRSSRPPPLPAMQNHVEIEVLDLRVADKEYHTALAVLVGNYSDTLRLAPDLESLQTTVLERQQRWAAAAAAAAGDGDADTEDVKSGHDSGASNLVSGSHCTDLGKRGSSGIRMMRGWSHMVAGTRAALPGMHDFTKTVASLLVASREYFNMGVTVLVRQASLQLSNQVPNSPNAQALAKLVIRDLWCSYSTSTGQGMFVQLALPEVSIHDMRPGIPSTNTLVFSTSDVAAMTLQDDDTYQHALSPSLMFLEYRYFKPSTLTAVNKTTSLPQHSTHSSKSQQHSAATSGHTSVMSGSTSNTALQAVRLRLQQPTLVLDLAFLVPLLSFVAPSAAVAAGAVPAPWSSREIFLGKEPYIAKGDIWLSPEVRLLADAPGATSFILDGAGHSLVLPANLHPNDAVSLILIGPHSTLQLKNVKIVNGGSMAACLQLGAGAQLIARPEDGVEWCDSAHQLEHHPHKHSLDAQHHEQQTGHTEHPRLQGMTSYSSGKQHMSGSGGGAARTNTASGAATAPVPCIFEVQLDAYSASLHLLDSSEACQTYGGSTGSLASTMTTGASRGPSLVSRPMQRSGSMNGSAGGGNTAGMTSVLDTTPSQGPQISTGACVMRRLVLTLDATLAGRMLATSQTWQLGLQSLTISTHTMQLANPSSTLASASLRKPPLPTATGSLAKVDRANGVVSRPVQHQILKPCDIAITYSSDNEAKPATTAAPDGSTQEVAGSAAGLLGQTSLALDVTALSFTLAPDVLQFMLGLYQSISKPLIVPSPSQPMLRCNAYERIWCSTGDDKPVGPASVLGRTLTVSSTGRGGVDPWTGCRGLTIWRPQPPSGYLLLGDVIVAGAMSAPQFPVAVMAVNSGFVAWPVQYEVAWSAGEGLVLWQPVAPPGYVSMGLVASRGLNDVPSTQLVACVRKEAVVQARCNQCVMLCAAGNLWSVANVGCTVVAAPKDAHSPQSDLLLDLRLPLGVAPAALTPVAGLLQTSQPATSQLDREDDVVVMAQVSKELQARFLEQRSALAHSVSTDALTAVAVEFRRLWWDRRSTSGPSGCQVSFWRPVAPQGYVAVGDCLVTGVYAPPQQALLVRDMPPSPSSLGRAPTSQAMVVKPLGYARVWADEHKAKLGESRYLSLWRPVPPAGYVAMGCVVGFGNMPPPTGIIRCVRSDLVSPVPLNRTMPSWVHPPHRQRTPVVGWLVDDRTNTFIALPQEEAQRLMQQQTTSGSYSSGGVSGSGGSMKGSRLEGYRLKLPFVDEAAGQSAEHSSNSYGKPTARHLSLDVRASSTTLLLQSVARQPLLELGLQDIKTGLGTQEAGVMRGYLFGTLSLWSFAAGQRVWEPLIEPWQVLAHADINQTGLQCSGVEPGAWLRLTSTQSTVHASLTHGAAAALLVAAKEWSAILSNTETSTTSSLKADGDDSGRVTVSVENQLGVDVELAVDDGGAAQEVASIPAGMSHNMQQTLPQPPPSPLQSLSTASASARASLPVASLKLVVDVLALQNVSSTQQPGAYEAAFEADHVKSFGKDLQLACMMEVIGPLAELMPGSTWGCSTRAVPKAVSEPGHADSLPSSRSVSITESASPTIRKASTSSSTPGTQLSGSAWEVAWNERFLVPLPSALSDQLVGQHSASAENREAWAGVPLTLRFLIVDHDRPAMPVLAAAAAAVEYDWLVNQVSLLRIAGASAGRDSAGTAADEPERLTLMLPMQLMADPSGTCLGLLSDPGTKLVAAITLDCQQVDVLLQTMQTGRDKSGAGLPGQASSRGASSLAPAAQRLLRVPPHPTWYPLPEPQGPARASSSSMAWRTAATGSRCAAFLLSTGEGAVLETSLATQGRGRRQEVLRSLCKVVNTTDLALQVSMVIGSDEAAWTMIPQPAPAAKQQQQQLQQEPTSSSAPATKQIVEEEVFENECFVPLRGWSHTHLLAGDRLRFNRSRGSGGDSTSFPQVPLPAVPYGQQGHWEWDSAWEVETSGYVDKDGWAYGNSWSSVSYPFSPGCGSRRPTDWVRRRRWVRRCVFRPNTPGSHPISQQSLDSGRRRILGVLSPGSSVALPLGWSSEGCDLQFRPLLQEPDVQTAASDDEADAAEALGLSPHPLLLDPNGEALHSWSTAGANAVGMDLSDLTDGGTHLVCCGLEKQAAVARLARPASQAGAAGSPAQDDAQVTQAALAALLQPHWFSLTVDCDMLVMAQGSGDILPDWHVMIRPPMVIENALPVTSRYCVWERNGGAGGPLRCRQQGTLEPWESRPVYTVDMRQQVCLTFTPEGCEFAESEPLVIMEGVRSRPFAGAAGAPRLPDSFKCTYSNTHSVGAGLRLSIAREVDLQNAVKSAATESSSSSSKQSFSSAYAGSVQASGGSFGGDRSIAGTGGRGLLAEAVARGSPLTVRVSAPLVVVNNTQLPVCVGVLPLEVSPQRESQSVVDASFSAAAASKLGPSMAMGLDGNGPLRILDTEAFTSCPRPTNHITLLPRSLELLALPPGYGYSSDVQPAVAISCQGSRWCAPLPLPAPATSMTRPAPGQMPGPGNSLAASNSMMLLSGTDPVVVRARSRPDGNIHDLVVRFEPNTSTTSTAGGFGVISNVIHIDTHLVVTNRTGYPLQLIQPESWSAAPSSPATPLGTGAAAAGLQAHSSPLTPARPVTPSMTPSRTSSVRTDITSTTLGAAVEGISCATPGVVCVPAGAVGMPLVWHASSTRKLLCLALQAPRGESPEEQQPHLLTDPLSIIQLPVGTQVQLLLPIQAIGAASNTQRSTTAVHAQHHHQHTPSMDSAADIHSMLRPLSHAHSASQPDIAINPSPASSMLLEGTTDTADQAKTAYEEAVSAAAGILARSIPGGDLMADSSDALPNPSWVRLSRQGQSEQGQGQAKDTNDYVGVVVTMQLEALTPGCLCLVLLSVGSEPAHLIQNTTPFPLAVREHAPRCPWQVLPPWSGAGYVRRDLGSLTAQPALEMEVADPQNTSTGSPQVLTFDTGSSGAGTSSSADTGASSGGSASMTGVAVGAGSSQTTSLLLRLGCHQVECSGQTSLLRELVMSSAGPHLAPGNSVTASSSLGGAAVRADCLLRVVPLPQRPSGKTAGGTGGCGHGIPTAAACQIPPAGLLPANITAACLGSHYSVEISGLEVSLVDDRPQELLVATLDGLAAEYHVGSSGGVDYTQVVLRIRNMQVDDQLPSTPHPVLLLPMDASRQESSSASHDPLLYASYVLEPSRRRDGLYYPTLTARILPLKVAVAEGTLWRLVACLDGLQKLARRPDAIHGMSDDKPSLSSQKLPSANQITAREQVKADLPLVMNFMNLEDLQVCLSFKPDPSSRKIANQLLSLSLDFVALEDLNVELPGLHLERVRVQHSALTKLIYSRLQQRLLGMVFSILRNAGVLGSTSKILAVASQGMAQLTDTRGSSSSSGREVGNLGEGVLEGGKALAKGVLAGAVGILAKPVEGMERGGVTGLLEGVTKGVAGVLVNPLSGVLSAAAKVTEGMDATYGKMRETIFTAPRRSGRKRLPRAIKGDQILTVYSLHPALGQALMHAATLPPVSTTVLTAGLSRQVISRLTGGGSSSRKAAGAAARASILSTYPLLMDFYEDHFMLPGAKVLLITSTRIALIEAPEFVSLQQGVMSGDITHVKDVPGGEIKWSLTWDEMLAAELTWNHQQPGQPPDGVIIHRKERSPIDNALVHDVRCRPASSQAQQVLEALMTTCHHYRRTAVNIDMLPAPAPVLITAQDKATGQSSPDSVLSLDYKLVWMCHGSGRQGLGRSRNQAKLTVSVWRPVGPSGYGILGDVIVVGTEAPSRPVRMFRDRAGGLVPLSQQQQQRGPRDAPGESPRLTPPVGYSLMFRDSATPPLTLWRPIPRKGYVEVGCIAWPAMEEPPLTIVRCVRRDLVQPAPPHESPVWVSTSSDNQFWKSSIWPIDNECQTFIAVKGETKPRQAWAPLAIH